MRDFLKKITTGILKKKSIIFIFVLFSIVASVQSLSSGGPKLGKNGEVISYTKYNNYVIFERSFFHLKNNQDLYILYPQEHWDLYKYTPTFSAFFGFFALFPDWLGLNLWNLLNAMVLLFSVYYLPKLTSREKGIILLIALIELMTSMQNEQSNGLIAGLLVLTFGLLENKKYLPATFCVIFSGFIKLFGIVGLALFLFYPKKWKLALYSLLWTGIFFAIPLLFVSYDQYIALFQSYGRMLSADHASSYGYSVMGWLNSWFNLDISKNMVVLAGGLIFLLPFLKLKQYQNLHYKYLILASVLIWMVIFNHKAESPTFIIAVTGVALWFIYAEKNLFNISIFVFCFLFTVLSPTDLFPREVRESFIKPFQLKVAPCIFIWLTIIYSLIRLKKDEGEAISPTSL